MSPGFAQGMATTKHGMEVLGGELYYSIANTPSIVHDLLLQKSSREFELVVWGEQVAGANSITVDLGGSCAKVKIFDTTAALRQSKS